MSKMQRVPQWLNVTTGNIVPIWHNAYKVSGVRFWHTEKYDHV